MKFVPKFLPVTKGATETTAKQPNDLSALAERL